MADGLSGSFITLQIEDPATPSAWRTVGGQRDVTLGEVRSEIDVSSKDQAEERTLPGRLVQEVTLDHLYIPDVTAVEIGWLKDAIRNGTQIRIQRWEDTDGDNTMVAVEEADATVLEFSLIAPDQEAAVYSTRMKVSGGWQVPTP